MKPIVFLAGASGLACLALAAPVASASYMETCKALISTWDDCRAAGKTCLKEEKVIEAQCKCHAKKDGVWKLVNAAVAKDDVCDAADPPVPEDIYPPPEPRPSREILDKSRLVPSEPEERHR
ncbi:MAG: hypothetical protein CMK09_11700 [Ponticaulis sp.]|nr:hypothetical protein [Ponticaulis sp.]